MRKHLAKLVIFLLAGAVVNVAVAWGCVGWAPPPVYKGIVAGPPTGSAWPCKVPRDWPERAEVAAVDDGFGVTATGYWTYTKDKNGTHDTNVLSWTYGWPRRCTSAHLLNRGTSWTLAQVLRASDTCRRCGAYVGESSVCTTCMNWNAVRIGSQQRALAVGPIWPGFAINTLFYAAILWLIILGPFVVRRLIRRRRGLCPACGYDLRHAEHEACPECGLAA